MKKDIAIIASIITIISTISFSLFNIIEANNQLDFEKEDILSSHFHSLSEKANVIYEAELKTSQVKGESYTSLGAMTTGAIAGFIATSWSGPGAIIGAGVGCIAGWSTNLLGFGGFVGKLCAPSLDKIKEKLRNEGHQEGLIESEGYMKMGE